MRNFYCYIDKDRFEKFKQVLKEAIDKKLSIENVLRLSSYMINRMITKDSEVVEPGENEIRVRVFVEFIAQYNDEDEMVGLTDEVFDYDCI